MVPVATVHVGCVGVTVGAAGVGGCAFITAAVAVETQPKLFFTVTWYVPGATLVKVPVVLL